MDSKKPTVFDFLEAKEFPKVVTVERTQVSKYLFYLVMRAYKKKFRLKPVFCLYSAKEQGAIKGLIEEHSLFEKGSLYVLEGFPLSFVENLTPPSGVYVVAEIPGGQYTAPPYSLKNKRGILKALVELLGLDPPLKLRPLLSLDWSSCRSYEAYESVLRKTKLMGWTEEDLGKELTELDQVSILYALKRGTFKEVFDMIGRYGSIWVYNYLISYITDLVQYRALKLMGYEEQKINKEMELGYRKAMDLVEASKLITLEDLIALTDKILYLDGLLFKNKDLGLSLFVLNSPIKITK